MMTRSALADYEIGDSINITVTAQVVDGLIEMNEAYYQGNPDSFIEHTDGTITYGGRNSPPSLQPAAGTPSPDLDSNTPSTARP